VKVAGSGRPNRGLLSLRLNRASLVQSPAHGSRRARSVPPTAKESWSVSSIRSRRPGEAKAASALRRGRPWFRGGTEWPLVAVLAFVVISFSPLSRRGGTPCFVVAPKVGIARARGVGARETFTSPPKITPTGDRFRMFQPALEGPDPRQAIRFGGPSPRRCDRWLGNARPNAQDWSR
jgi:hypothetical protein